MQIASIDFVDIVFWIFYPPVGAVVVYGVAYALARGFSGGRPLSPLARIIFRYMSLFTLGMGYLMAMFLAVFKLPNWGLWVSVMVWAALVVWFAVWRHGKEKRSDGKVTTAPTP